jgi:hypothetical protein
MRHVGVAGEPGERDFFEYVAESYRFFLAADDVQCEAVDAAKAAQFEVRAGSVRDDIDGLEQVRCVVQLPGHSRCRIRLHAGGG